MSDEAQGVFAAHLTAAQLEQNPSFIDDVQRGVIFVPWPRPPRAGVRVVVTLAVGSEPPLDVESLVVWSRPARAGIVAGFGAQLVGAPEALLLRLRSFARSVRHQSDRTDRGFVEHAGRVTLEAPVQERVRSRASSGTSQTLPPSTRFAPAPSGVGTGRPDVHTPPRGASHSWDDGIALELDDDSMPVRNSVDGNAFRQDSYAQEPLLSYGGAAEFGPEHFADAEEASPEEESPFLDSTANSFFSGGAQPDDHSPAFFDVSSYPHLSEPEPTPFPLGDLQPDPTSTPPPRRRTTSPPPSPPAPAPLLDFDLSSPATAASMATSESASESSIEFLGMLTPEALSSEIGIGAAASFSDSPPPSSFESAPPLRPGDQFLPRNILAERGSGGATLDRGESGYADPLEFLRPVEATPGPLPPGRRRINVQHPAPHTPPPGSQPHSTTPLAPDGMPAFSAELLDDLGFDPGTEALLPSLPILDEEEDEVVEGVVEGVADDGAEIGGEYAGVTDHFPTTPLDLETSPTHAGQPGSDDSFLDVLATEAAASAALEASATPPPIAQELPPLEEFESALDQLGESPALPVPTAADFNESNDSDDGDGADVLDALDLLPLDLGTETFGSESLDTELIGADAPGLKASDDAWTSSDAASSAHPVQRLTFGDAETFLAEYSASLEHGLVRVVSDELPEPGEEVELELEIPDGDAPLRVVAIVERYLTAEESEASGWVGVLRDPEGEVADRLGNAVFALM